MKIFLVFPTALEFWMRFDHSIKLKKPVRNISLDECGIDKTRISYIIQQWNFSSPIHIGVTHNYCRSRGDNISCHKIDRIYTNNSFIEICKDIYVGTPEACFLQASRSLKIPELVNLANNLCGGYCFDQKKLFDIKLRPPVTTVKKIIQYLNEAGSCSGSNKACKTIRYAVDNAFSPAESKNAAIAVLPLRYGGYGLPKPVMNPSLKLSNDGARLFGLDHCKCDLAWPDKRVVAEYDSTLVHLEKKQHIRDKKKYTALIDSGYKVVMISEAQIQSFREMEGLFRMLRKDLGVKNRNDRLEKHLDARWKTYRLLFREHPKRLY